MHKKEQIIKLIKHSIEQYLLENLDYYGFCTIIDVNMAQDLKTAYIYIGCPIEKNEKTLENSIVNDNSGIVKIFKEYFTAKFLPKLKFTFIKDSDVKF